MSKQLKCQDQPGPFMRKVTTDSEDDEVARGILAVDYAQVRRLSHQSEAGLDIISKVEISKGYRAPL